MSDCRGKNIVVGVSGGIAAYKAVLVVRALTELGHDVRVVPTEAALRFVGAPTWEALTHHRVSTTVWDDVHEVQHVKLGQQADVVVVVPATADVMARAVAGRADDLLTTTLLATRAPVMMVPAMHTEMWQHPATVANVATLRSRGVLVCEPDSGRLTGADSGPGRLPEPEAIVATVDALAGAQRKQDLVGRHVVISAGGTQEALDPVRFLSNRSSGKQGHALAAAALTRGARVTLVTCAHVAVPAGVDVVRVSSALSLQDAMLRVAETADVVVMAAAVSDYRPAEQAAHKLKKSGSDELVLRLTPNPDILHGLVQQRRAGQVIVGFAAETGDDSQSALEHALAKLKRKGCDFLVLNDVSDGAVFGQDGTAIQVLSIEHTPRARHFKAKVDAAHHIFDCVGSSLQD